MFEKDEFDNEEIIVNQEILTNKLVPWQNGYMHPDEYREGRLVQFHGVPQMK